MWFKPSIKTQDITQLTRQLSTLLKANINLLTALHLLQKSLTKSQLIKLIAHLSQTIKQGKLLSQSLAQFPQYFDNCYCALIAIGEQSNRLDQSFEQLAQQRERQAELQNKLRSALTYPCLMLVVALFIGIILLLKVVPQFEQLFAGFNHKLPTLTQFFLGLTHVLQHYGGTFLLTILILLLSVYFIIHRSQPAKSWLKHSLLYLPIVHRLIKLHVSIRFCQTLATLLDANLTLTSALQLCSQTLPYRPYRQGLQKTYEAIYQGHYFCAALTNTGLFPPLLLQMLTIGEQSQQLVPMLHYLAKHYEQQLTKQLAQLTKFIEPGFIIITGGVIGSLVIALYVPIFQLGHVV